MILTAGAAARHATVTAGTDVMTDTIDVMTAMTDAMTAMTDVMTDAMISDVIDVILFLSF